MGRLALLPADVDRVGRTARLELDAQPSPARSIPSRRTSATPRSRSAPAPRARRPAREGVARAPAVQREVDLALQRALEQRPGVRGGRRGRSRPRRVARRGCRRTDPRRRGSTATPSPRRPARARRRRAAGRTWRSSGRACRACRRGGADARRARRRSARSSSSRSSWRTSSSRRNSRSPRSCAPRRRGARRGCGAPVRRTKRMRLCGNRARCSREVLLERARKARAVNRVVSPEAAVLDQDPGVDAARGRRERLCVRERGLGAE